jgi:hypothetical protein
MLMPLVRNKIISVWEDTEISAGDEWRGEIKEALARTKAAVLLVSPYFREFRRIRAIQPLKGGFGGRKYCTSQEFRKTRLNNNPKSFFGVQDRCGDELSFRDWVGIYAVAIGLHLILSPSTNCHRFWTRQKRRARDPLVYISHSLYDETEIEHYQAAN